jgi:putative DNA methylase
LKISSTKWNYSKINPNGTIRSEIKSDWHDFVNKNKDVLLLCCDSAKPPLSDKSVDCVVTVPPYFDFVHYSELRDIFYAWLAPVLCGKYPEFLSNSSGRSHEVQHTETEVFSRQLSRVYFECNRVLKDSEKLCFSFHHSRPEGWKAIADALVSS